MNGLHKKAFTMIELIFVIVIIGILAAVAVPKLAATRDDAKISTIITHARKALGDFQLYYTSQGNENWTANTTLVGMATSVSLSTSDSCADGSEAADDQVAGDTFYLCDEKGGADCISFTTDVNGTIVTIAASSGTNSVICQGVVDDPAIIGLTGGDGNSIDHKLGGAGVQR